MKDCSYFCFRAKCNICFAHDGKKSLVRCWWTKKKKRLPDIQKEKRAYVAKRLSVWYTQCWATPPPWGGCEVAAHPQGEFLFVRAFSLASSLVSHLELTRLAASRQWMANRPDWGSRSSLPPQTRSETCPAGNRRPSAAPARQPKWYSGENSVSNSLFISMSTSTETPQCYKWIISSIAANTVLHLTRIYKHLICPF